MNDRGAPVTGGDPARFIAAIHAQGLERARALLEALPPGGLTGFVLFISAEPSKPGQWAEWLARYSSMPVVEAEDGMPVLANTVHLTPAAGHWGIRGGLLELHPEGLGDKDDAYDLFLQALARSEGPRAIAYLPAGHEDAAGPRMIREAGGCLVTTGLLPGARVIGHPADNLDGSAARPDESGEMAPPLLAHPDGPTARGPGPAAMKDAATPPPIPEPHARSGFFGGADALRALWERLRQSAEERLAEGGDLRVWVLGCGRGEEAYTIAMIAADAVGAAKLGPLPLKVFAADMDPAAIEVARRAIYPDEAVQAVPPDDLARYFVKDAAGWRVAPRLRDRLVFSRLNLDAPPLSRLDLVVCRNLLSSLAPDVHPALMAKLRFALKPGGLLLLGPGDEARDFDGFDTLSAALHLHRRAIAPPAPDAPMALKSPPAPSDPADLLATLRAATEAFAPPTVLIDGSGTVFATVGEVDRFLSLSGPAASDPRAAPVLRLRHGVIDAITDAGRTGRPVYFATMPAVDGSKPGTEILRIQRVPHDRAGRLVVSFLGSRAGRESDGAASPDAPPRPPRFRAGDREPGAAPRDRGLARRYRPGTAAGQPSPRTRPIRRGRAVEPDPDRRSRSGGAGGVSAGEPAGRGRALEHPEQFPGRLPAARHRPQYSLLHAFGAPPFPDDLAGCRTAARGHRAARRRPRPARGRAAGARHA